MSGGLRDWRSVSGPWRFEPEVALWGFDLGCWGLMARHCELGHWCGYVGVPPDHVAHGVGYGDVLFGEISVHGGLTYSDYKTHIFASGVPWSGHWFVGFDCAHLGDLCPGMPGVYDGIYRDEDYVRDEVRRLFRQLASLNGMKKEAHNDR